MAYSSNTLISDGRTVTFPLPFTYLKSQDVKVTVDGIAAEFEFNGAQSIQLLRTPARNSVIKIYRDTPITEKAVTFVPGAQVSSASLNANADQVLMKLQELCDCLAPSQVEFRTMLSSLQQQRADITQALRTLENRLATLQTFESKLSQCQQDIRHALETLNTHKTTLDACLKRDSLGQFGADNKRIGSLAAPLLSSDATTKEWCERELRGLRTIMTQEFQNALQTARTEIEQRLREPWRESQPQRPRVGGLDTSSSASAKPAPIPASAKPSATAAPVTSPPPLTSAKPAPIPASTKPSAPPASAKPAPTSAPIKPAARTP